MATESHFDGFPAEGLKFLRDLKRNNDRAWFAPRKELYERAVLEPLRAFVVETGEALGRAKIPLRGDAKRSVFRIYRDVRFSNDKSPYKTHASAYLSYDGGRTAPGGLYVHVEPKASFAAAAFYGIEKPMLDRWRASMAAQPARFERVLAALARAKVEISGPDEHEDSLARMPRGFEAAAETKLAPYFRLKHFTVRESLDDELLGSRDLIARCVSLAKAAKPLLEFGWSLD
jgi:uncharacterized protein (TIGR02453 family)